MTEKAKTQVTVGAKTTITIEVAESGHWAGTETMDKMYERGLRRIDEAFNQLIVLAASKGVSLTRHRAEADTAVWFHISENKP